MSKRRATDEDPAASGNTDKKAELAAAVRALNTQFGSWIQSQEATNIDYLWTAGVEDYIKHAKKIQADFSDVIDPHKQPKKQYTDTIKAPRSQSTTLFPPPAEKPTSFGTFQPSSSSFPAATSAPPPTITFGGASSSATSTTTTSTSLFGSGPPPNFGASTTSSFGSGSTGFGAGLGGGGFGAGAGALFQFPAPTPATAIPGSGGGEDGEGGGEGEEEDGGAKFDAQLQKDEGSNVLFQTKGKAAVKNGSGWDNKGVGQLTIRALKGTEKHFVSLQTDAGRALMSGSITKLSKPQVPGNEDPKAKVKRLLVPLVMEHDGKTQSWLTMLTVGNDQVREELKVKLTQLSSS